MPELLQTTNEFANIQRRIFNLSRNKHDEVGVEVETALDAKKSSDIIEYLFKLNTLTKKMYDELFRVDTSLKQKIKIESVARRQDLRNLKDFPTVNTNDILLWLNNNTHLKNFNPQNMTAESMRKISSLLHKIDNTQENIIFLLEAIEAEVEALPTERPPRTPGAVADKWTVNESISNYVNQVLNVVTKEVMDELSNFTDLLAHKLNQGGEAVLTGSGIDDLMEDQDVNALKYHPSYQRKKFIYPYQNN